MKESLDQQGGRDDIVMDEGTDDVLKIHNYNQRCREM